MRQSFLGAPEIALQGWRKHRPISVEGIAVRLQKRRGRTCLWLTVANLKFSPFERGLPLLSARGLVRGLLQSTATKALRCC